MVSTTGHISIQDGGPVVTCFSDTKTTYFQGEEDET